MWFMRQAGRYLPEYRAIRAETPLEKMFTTPSIATEITLQPIRRFGFDAAILFADILTPCAGFGLDVSFDGGPQVTGKAGPFDISQLDHVKETIHRLKKELQVPLIGFCGGPYTVGKYLQTHIDHDALIDGTIQYLKMQIEAGVDALQIFDSWAGHLPKAEFKSRILPVLKTILDAIRPFPTIVFTRGSCRLIDELVSLEPTGIGFDWDLSISEVRRRVPRHIAVQGNLNPKILKQPADEIEKNVTEILQSMEGEPGFIFNLGHGMSPDIPVDAVSRCKAVLHL